jgi:hypothetical protein
VMRTEGTRVGELGQLPLPRKISGGGMHGVAWVVEIQFQRMGWDQAKCWAQVVKVLHQVTHWRKVEAKF